MAIVFPQHISLYGLAIAGESCILLFKIDGLARTLTP